MENDSRMEDTNLEQIIVVLENMESQNLSNDAQIQDWLEQITDPEFQLVDSLINLFLNHMSDKQTTSNIFKVLRYLLIYNDIDRKFNIYQKDNVLPQMQENTKFPLAISEYITKTDIKELSGDAFFLLSDIFQTSSFKEITNEAFVKALFDGLQIITDEENFNAIVKILTQINYEESVLDNKKTESTFIKVYVNHDSSRILIESLVRILNYEQKDKDVLYKVLQCFSDIIDATDDSVMYSSDLESFINLSIEKLQSTYTDELRFHILNVIQKLTKYEEYYKTKYKMDELIEVMESYIDHHAVAQINKDQCKSILDNFNIHNH